jgi:vacuolar-type H+-ATPase subunit H
MEKVWDELKKIEAQAEQIQGEAQDRAKKMVLLAKKDAEKLVENSKTYAEAESQKLHSEAIEEADRRRNDQLTANEETVAKLKSKAEKRMDKAVSVVVNAVLEDSAI